MAKKRKHQKTDRRSVERRLAHEAELRAARQTEKNLLISKYGFDKFTQAYQEGRTYNPSLKDLKKERAQQRTKSEVNQTKAKTSEKEISPNRAQRKLAARIEKQNQKRTQWIKRQHDNQEREFFTWKYAHPLKNTHGYSWFDAGDIPHMNPKNAKERLRDKKQWEAMQVALNNPNQREARETIDKIKSEIIQSLKIGKSEARELAMKGKLSFRAITATRRNEDWENYLNYLAAAKARGLHILVDAIEEGGVGFVHWLYYTVGFDWADFYSDDGFEIGFDEADNAFMSLCNTYKADSQWGTILTKAYDEYVAETPISTGRGTFKGKRAQKKDR